MDVEQLKIIMETLAQMGETGKDAFVWYLAIVYGGSLLKHMLWSGVFFSGLYLLAARLSQAINKVK